MKKIISLCLSIIMLLSFSTTAFAAEYWDESAGSGESQVYAHIYSSYSISIPATIDLRNGEQGAVTLTEANIESGYEVNVYCTNLESNGILLYHTENSSISITCMLTDVDNTIQYDSNTPLVTFVQDDYFQGAITKYFGMHIMDIAKAGDYVGTMEYSFCCEPITE